jgi:ribonuclease Z
MTVKMKLIFLGTSGAVPSVKRNHPSMLLSYKKENILVDCGEGTQRQFRKARISPLKTTRILITHWHGDHILGIPGLLQTLSLNDYRKTLFIHGPKGIKKNMNNLIKAFPSVMGIKIKVQEVDGKFLETKEFYIESKKMSHGIPTNAYAFVKKGQRRIDKKKLSKSKLPSGSLLQRLKKGKNITYKGKKYLAKNLTYKEGEKKISFVLDTTLNRNIVPFVKNSDLLVIESTYSDEARARAKEYKHMTVKQDAEIARKARVKKLFLTHLSGRYEKNPEKILKEAKKIFKSSYLAKDLDVVEI